MRIFLTLLTFLFTCVINATESEKLENALIMYFQEKLPNYQTAYFDLNDDGIRDAFVYINDRNWCGTGGCTSFVFVGTSDGFKFQSKTMITQKPILVTSNATNGWYDLIVNTGGVGQVVLAFDGSKYPLNPSTQPKVIDSQLNNMTYLLK